MTHDPARRARIVAYYTVQHLTLREIGRLEGVSGPAVLRHLRAAGVRREDGTWAAVACAACQTMFRARRTRLRRSKRLYCGRACYWRARQTTPDPHVWRMGNRLARRVVAALYPALTPANVVHHHDGNARNNRPANLAVFLSQREHMRYHHDPTSARPIWDGRLLPLD